MFWGLLVPHLPIDQLVSNYIYKVLVFRGTVPWQIKNWIQDINFVPTKYPLCDNGCKVHKGFYNDYVQVKDHLKTLVESYGKAFNLSSLMYHFARCLELQGILWEELWQLLQLRISSSRESKFISFTLLALQGSEMQSSDSGSSCSLRTNSKPG